MMTSSAGCTDAIELFPGNQRKTLRQIAGALGMSTTVVFKARHGENSFIEPHTNCIKPYLTEQNKYGCICFALECIGRHQSERRAGGGERGANHDSTLVYDDYFNSIHVDEKWFFLAEENMRYYTTTKEKEEGKTPRRF
jgi:hypothetical protein